MSSKNSTKSDALKGAFSFKKKGDCNLSRILEDVYEKLFTDYKKIFTSYK